MKDFAGKDFFFSANCLSAQLWGHGVQVAPSAVVSKPTPARVASWRGEERRLRLVAVLIRGPSAHPSDEGRRGERRANFVVAFIPAPVTTSAKGSDKRGLCGCARVVRCAPY